MSSRRSIARLFLCLIFASLLSACASWQHGPGVGASLRWSQVPGWQEDRHAEAWPALLQTCKVRGTSAEWAGLCQAAAVLGAPDDQTAKTFFETWFVPHRVVAADGGRDGLITGYYEPVLRGSPVKTERFRYPIYQPPDDLLTIDLGDLYPELRGRPVRGRLDGNRVVPYHSRADIEQARDRLAGQELLWVEDPVALFFLQIQGSGRVQLPTGEQFAVGYADQNGHPYVALGKCLIEKGVLEPKDVTLQSIRAWLTANPTEAERMLNCNPSYIFFRPRDISPEQGPIGALNVPLTAKRSIAVDPGHISLGSPVWLDTVEPGTEAPLRRLVFAQDTGGAIRGPVRADLFCGQGETAEALAGTMKQRGRLIVLLPKGGQTIALK